MSFTEEVRQLLEENYRESDFGYVLLCDLLGRSRSQIYRLFQKANLGSPSAYIRKYRLEKAKELLVSTDLLIQEIAYQVGYESAGHFSNSFIDYYGVSPKVFRSKYCNY